MTLQSILEKLSFDSYWRLRDSHSLGIRFGEETMTDLILLELKRFLSPNIKIIQTPKPAEAKKGTDWEWWIGSDRAGWTRYAVQAKKMHSSTLRYSGISQRTGPKLQIDVLDSYAKTNGAVAIYLFYNSPTAKFSEDGWNCCREFNAFQLSCTISPSQIVRPCIHKRGTKNFNWIHNKIESLPWRCLTCTKAKGLVVGAGLESKIIHLVDNPEYQREDSTQETQLAEEVENQPQRRDCNYAALPETISYARQRGVLTDYPADLYDDKVRSYPRRILVLESSEHEEIEDGV
jgi:hypothetical protein